MLMVTYTECKVIVVPFCNIFKILLRAHFNVNIVIIAKLVIQDMLVFARDGVEQVWSESLGLPFSMHIGRKFDDGLVGKKNRIKEILPTIENHARFLFLCKNLAMKNVFCKKKIIAIG